MLEGRERREQRGQRLHRGGRGRGVAGHDEVERLALPYLQPIARTALAERHRRAEPRELADEGQLVVDRLRVTDSMEIP